MINKVRLLKRSAIAALLIFTGFVGGTYFGFSFTVSYMRFGIDVPDGTIAAAQLERLEKGNAAPIKMDLESKVDSALAGYSYASEEWWFPLYEDGWTLYSPAEFESYLRLPATYRKTHPSPYRNAFTNMTEKWKQNPDNQELAAFSQDYHRRIDAMVERFAKK